MVFRMSETAGGASRVDERAARDILRWAFIEKERRDDFARENVGSRIRGFGRGAAREPFVRLMDEILEARAANPNADTECLEWGIASLVYGLHGLTYDEATAAERRLGLMHASDEDEDEALVRAMANADGSDWVSKGEAPRPLRVGNGDYVQPKLHPRH